MRNRLMGVYLTFAAFAVLAGCAATEIPPDTVTVADAAVADTAGRRDRAALVTVTVPETVTVPTPEVVTVPEPTVVDTAVAVDDAGPEADTPTVDKTVTDETPMVDETVPPDDTGPEEEASAPEYVSPEEEDLPPVDETVTMDCVDWAQADGLAYEDAAALCDALSSEGYPTSDLTHEQYEWNFTDQATGQEP